MTESKEAEAKEQQVRAEIVSKMDTTAFTFHKKTVQQTLKDLDVTLEFGLSSKQVEQRQKEYGPNELEEEEGESLWDKVIEQFKDTLV